MHYTPLTLAEQARIEADAYIGAFHHHRQLMNPASRADRVRERRLHALAQFAELRARRLEQAAAGKGATA